MSAAIRYHEIHGQTGLPGRPRGGAPKTAGTSTPVRRPHAAQAVRPKSVARQTSHSKYSTISLREAIHDMFVGVGYTAYEGDGFARIPAGGTAPAEPVARTSEGVAWRRLLAKAGNAFARFFEWLEDKTREAQLRAVESYLAKSTDIADLERRMRSLEQGPVRTPFG